MKKILFLQFPLKPAWGGAENHTLTLALGLKKLGYEAVLLSSNKYLVRKFLSAGMSARHAWMGWEPTSVGAIFLFPITLVIFSVKFIVRLVQLRSDMAFCLSLTDKLVATPLLQILRCDVFWIEHTRIGRWLYQNPFRPWYRRMARVANKIVAPSYFLRNQLIGVGVPVDQITVIYPGISVTPVSSPPKLRREGGLFTLGYLGRLTQEKGVDILIRALSRFDKNTKLLIGGVGPEEENLKRLIQNLGLKGKVTFSGAIENKERFFSQINALVVPSVKAEAFGLVVLEAMASDVPVIASRIGAIPEIIEHKKTGLLLDPGDHERLARTIKLLANDRVLCETIRAGGKQSVLTRFLERRMTEEFHNLLVKTTI